MVIKNREYKKILYCILVLIVFIICTIAIKIYFRPFFIIVIILFVCSPIYKKLCGLKLFSNKINGLISIFIFNIALIIFVYYLGNHVYKGKDVIINIVLKFISNLYDRWKVINSQLSLEFINLNSKMESFYTNIINSNFLTKSAAYTTEGILNYFIGNIAAYFILVDKYVILNWINEFFPNNRLYLIKNSVKNIKKILKVELSLILVTTLETVFGLMALGIENYIILGLLCGILDLLPYVGTILVFIPLAIYKIMLGEYIITFGLICLYILLVINRQILETKFMSSKFNIHPLVIILSLYLGIKMLGIIGLFAAPIYVIIAKEIIEKKT